MIDPLDSTEPRDLDDVRPSDEVAPILREAQALREIRDALEPLTIEQQHRVLKQAIRPFIEANYQRFLERIRQGK